MDKQFLSDIRIVEQAIQEAGFAPNDQLYGFVHTGNSLYITRKHNARKIVEQMDNDMIRKYLNLRQSVPKETK